MATYASIEFDFQAACDQASRLEHLAEQVDSLRKHKLGTALEELQSGWQGRSADAFQDKGRLMQQGLQETGKELYGIAQSIRIAARQIYEAEMAALRIAETRTY